MESGPGLELQPTARMAIVIITAVWWKKALILLLPILYLWHCPQIKAGLTGCGADVCRATL